MPIRYEDRLWPKGQPNPAWQQLETYEGHQIYYREGRFGAWVEKPGLQAGWIWRPTLAAIKKLLDGAYQPVKAIYVSGYNDTIQILEIVALSRGKFRQESGHAFSVQDMLYHWTPDLEAELRTIAEQMEALRAQRRNLLATARRVREDDIKQGKITPTW